MKKYLLFILSSTFWFASTIGVFAQTGDNFFKLKQVRKELLSIEGRRKLDNLEKQRGNLSVEYVEIGNLKKFQRDGKLKFKLPSGMGNFSYKTYRVEYESDLEYSWHGRSEHGFDDAYILSRQGKVFGTFSGPEGYFEFFTLDDGIQILLKKDPTLKGTCLSKHTSSEGVKGSKATSQARVGSCNNPIRVLVLYNAKANENGTATQLAEYGVYLYNEAANNSGLDYANRLELAGVLYNEFDETERYLLDDAGQKAYFNELRPNVHSIRDAYDADIVVHMLGGGSLLNGSRSFLAGPGEDGVYGFVNEVAPAPPTNTEGDNFAYLFVSASFISTHALFQHEIGHILGAEHEYGGGRPNKRPYAAAYSFTENGIDRRTIMWSGLTRYYIQHFSNPNVYYNGMATGVANLQDNARRIREYAPIVNTFQPSSEGNAYIEVRQPTANGYYYELEAIHSCRPALGFEWEVSPDVFNYGGVVSNSETYYAYLTHSPSGYNVVRCKVTFNNGTVWYAYTTIYNPYCPGCRTGTVSEVAADDQTLIVSPNPSTEQTAIRFTLDQPTEVGRLLVNAQGAVVQRVSFGRLEAGTHVHTLMVDKLPAGVYYVNLRTGNKSARQKLIVVR